MALSFNFKVRDVWAEAVRDVHSNVDVLSFERFDIINRCVLSVFNVFHSLVSPFMLRNAVVTETNGVVDISSLPINKGGEQVRMTLESSHLPEGVCTPLAMDSFMAFRPNASQNRNDIAYTIENNTLLLKKGYLLSDYGTLALHYSALPSLVTADTDKFDVPDVLLELVVIKIKMILNERYNLPKVDYSGEIARLLKGFYEQFGNSVKAEEVDEKVRALV